MNGVFGIGVDIEQIDRFKKFSYDTHNPFLRRVYTPAELHYCFASKNSAERLAARFAGKEAIMKAASSLGKKYPVYRDIEIKHRQNGAPVAAVRGMPKTMQIELSLSHTKDDAIAFALISCADSR